MENIESLQLLVVSYLKALRKYQLETTEEDLLFIIAILEDDLEDLLSECTRSLNSTNNSDALNLNSLQAIAEAIFEESNYVLSNIDSHFSLPAVQ
jgi:hypothetical protein